MIQQLKNNWQLLLIILCCTMTLSLRGQITEIPSTWILAVGIDNYKNLKSLDYSRSGAYKFINIFQRRGMIENTEPLLPKKATKDGIIAALKSSFVDNDQIKDTDMIIFYFSGHGTVLGDDIGAICPTDFSMRDPFSVVLYDTIQTIMNLSVARHKICFIEACKAPVNMGGVDPEIVYRIREEQSKVAPLSAFITSTEFNKTSKEESPEAGLGAGVFNHFLIKALEGDAYNYRQNTNNHKGIEEDPFLRIGEVFDYVRDKVSNHTRQEQIPQMLNLGEYNPELAIISLVDEMGSCANQESRTKYLDHDLVLISEAEFWQGSANPPSKGIQDESPPIKVQLDCYYLGKHEITVREFAQFVRETNYTSTAEQSAYGGSYVYYYDNNHQLQNEFSEGISWRYDHAGNFIDQIDYDSEPVVHVSWYDAINYCNWLSEREGLSPSYQILPNGTVRYFSDNGSYRLPTEAEWEYAAHKAKRNKLGEAWSGTSEEDKLYQYANYLGASDKYFTSAPIQSFLPNYLRIADMSGNVREWCWDKYSQYAYENVKKKSEYREHNIVLNPEGPYSGTRPRIVKGGSWKSPPIECRSKSRDFASPTHRDGVTGFRIVKSTPRSW